MSFGGSNKHTTPVGNCRAREIHGAVIKFSTKKSKIMSLQTESVITGPISWFEQCL